MAVTDVAGAATGVAWSIATPSGIKVPGRYGGQPEFTTYQKACQAVDVAEN